MTVLSVALGEPSPVASARVDASNLEISSPNTLLTSDRAREFEAHRAKLLARGTADGPAAWSRALELAAPAELAQAPGAIRLAEDPEAAVAEVAAAFETGLARATLCCANPLARRAALRRLARRVGAESGAVVLRVRRAAGQRLLDAVGQAAPFAGDAPFRERLRALRAHGPAPLLALDDADLADPDELRELASAATDPRTGAALLRLAFATGKPDWTAPTPVDAWMRLPEALGAGLSAQARHARPFSDSVAADADPSWPTLGRRDVRAIAATALIAVAAGAALAVAMRGSVGVALAALGAPV